MGRGPGKLEQWTLLARARALDSTCFIAAAGQAYPGDRLANASKAPTGWAAAWWPHRWARSWRRRAPIQQLVVTDLDIDRVASVRETLAVLRNRSEFAHIGAESPR